MHNCMGAGMFNYDKLDTLIKESGKTKTFLCKQIGKPPYYLRDVLKQRTTVPYDYQVILARELGVTVAYLNDEEETKKPATEVTGKSDRRSYAASFLEDATDEELEKYIAFMEFNRSQRKVNEDESANK